MPGKGIYTDHELRSGVAETFSVLGTDAISGNVAPVLNPVQPIASRRLPADASEPDFLDIDFSFVFEEDSNRRPAYINKLEGAIAARRRRLYEIAKILDVNHSGFKHVLDQAGVSYVGENHRMKKAGVFFIENNSIWNARSFRAAVAEHVNFLFCEKIELLRDSRRSSPKAAMLDYVRDASLCVERLELALKSGKIIANRMKALFRSVALGQTPDLETVVRTVRTAEDWKDMPILLSDICFYALINPAYIYPDFTNYLSVLHVIMFLGRVNYGIINPNRREAEAYLRETADKARQTPSRHDPFRISLMNCLNALCDWRAHHDLLASVCRDVVEGRRPESAEDRRQLWHLR